jgi:hypothetical protein
MGSACRSSRVSRASCLLEIDIYWCCCCKSPGRFMVVCAFSLHAVLKPEASFSFFILAGSRTWTGTSKARELFRHSCRKRSGLARAEKLDQGKCLLPLSSCSEGTIDQSRGRRDLSREKLGCSKNDILVLYICVTSLAMLHLLVGRSFQTREVIVGFSSSTLKIGLYWFLWFSPGCRNCSSKSKSAGLDLHHNRSDEDR